MMRTRRAERDVMLAAAAAAHVHGAAAGGGVVRKVPAQRGDAAGELEAGVMCMRGVGTGNLFGFNSQACTWPAPPLMKGMVK